MFEEQNQNQSTPNPAAQNPSQSPGVSSGQTTPAPDLPQQSPVPNQGDGVEDIFASTDAQGGVPQAPPGPPTALSQGKLKPLQGSSQGIPVAQASRASTGFPVKKMLIIVLVSFGIIGAGAGAFAILSNRSNAPVQVPVLGSPQNTPASNSNEDSDSPSVDPNETGATSDTSQQQTNEVLQNFQQNQIDRALNPIPQDPASKDTDQDGLSDAQEFGYGTNPRLVDSDADGLSDWEEIAIFGTNPLSRDSDNDSYTDGEEVQNGYNPLGPGKLLDFEQANPGE